MTPAEIAALRAKRAAFGDEVDALCDAAEEALRLQAWSTDASDALLRAGVDMEALTAERDRLAAALRELTRFNSRGEECWCWDLGDDDQDQYPHQARCDAARAALKGTP